MEETLKDRIILILFILTVIFFIGTVSSCSNALHNRANRDKEMLARIDLEEKIAKVIQDKAAAEGRLESASSELETEKAAHQAAEKTLAQERLVNESLKEDLEKITKLKEALEEDLKDALVKGKAAKSKQ